MPIISVRHPASSSFGYVGVITGRPAFVKLVPGAITSGHTVASIINKPPLVALAQRFFGGRHEAVTGF